MLDLLIRMKRRQFFYWFHFAELALPALPALLSQEEIVEEEVEENIVLLPEEVPVIINLLNQDFFWEI